jgi:hypothetical protein
MKCIQLLPIAGSFAENKDVAQSIRKEQIVPALERGESIAIDFEGVETATQGFIHALISELMRERGNEVLDRISFKNCSETVRKIIGIVVEYMQESE